MSQPRPGDPGFQGGYAPPYAQQGGYGGAGTYGYGSGPGAAGGNSPAQPGNSAHGMANVPRQPVCFFWHSAAPRPGA